MAHIEKGQVFVPATSVEYAEGSVVSREILRNNAGTLTLFAFDAGQGLSEHTAPFDATVTILDGEAEILLGGTPHIVKAGEMLIMPGRSSPCAQCKTALQNASHHDSRLRTAPFGYSSPVIRMKAECLRGSP